MLTQNELNILKQIPFCEIPHDTTELVEITTELKSNTEWYDYIPPRLISDEHSKQIYANYKGVTLTTFRPDKDKTRSREGKLFDKPVVVDGAEYMDYYDVPVADRKIYTTEISKNFPKTMEFLSKVTNKPKLCKLAHTTGKQRLWWHSHQRYKAPGQDYITTTEEQYILHVPIMTHDEVYHMINTKDQPTSTNFNFDNRDYYLSDPDIFHANFQENKLYFFNSYLNHAYVNFSDRPRLTLLIYNDGSDNPMLENLMRTMIENYNGPLIKDPWSKDEKI
jgi:hypothetical protein